MDLKELKKELDNVLEENNKVKYNKTLHEKYAQQLEENALKLENIIKEIRNISYNLNPTISIKIRSQNKINFKLILNDLYENLKQGTQITIELIQKSNPDLEQKHCYYLYDRLKKFPSVKITKDGTKSRLFI